MGLVNTVVPLEELEEETVRWCREMLELSPFALRLLKASFNAAEDGLAGIQQLAHDTNLLFYGSEEAQEGRDAYRRSASPTSASSRSGRDLSPLRLWLVAARPAHAARPPSRRCWSARRWPASEDVFTPLRFACALIGSVFIQIGTNLANDYSDARRGADTEDRLGPVRVTAGGLMPPRRVLVGTYVAFGIAVAAGAYLIAVAGWELLLVGVASIAAGVLYTGGPRPYGYEGLGELFVFLFFGVVAVVGSYFVQTEELRWEAFALSVPVGLLAAAILVVNNVRDVDTDRRAGKRTLAVKLGRDRARGAVRRDGRRSPSSRRSPWRRPAGCRGGSCCRSPRCRCARRSCGRCARAPTAPSLNARARRHGPAAGGLLAAAGGGGAAVVTRSLARLSIPFREPFATVGGRRAGARAASCCGSRTTTACVGLRRGGAVRALRRGAARARW